MTQHLFPRLMVAAPRKSSGKTLLSIGLTAALTAKGLIVQPFKKGPDFIDPRWLTLAANGRDCRNLDIFLMGRAVVQERFVRNGMGADISLIEGNHGLYDGQDIEGSDCGAGLAESLQSPVLLVVDCQGIARGVAPLVRGLQDFPGGASIKGLVLNNVATPRHEKRLRAAIDRYCSAPILGVLPRSAKVVIDERHLGLEPVGEREELADRIGVIGAFVAAHVDLDRIITLAQSAAPLDWAAAPPCSPSKLPPVRVAYAADRAFHFYYPDNLEALQAEGVELIPFSMLRDAQLPEADGLFIGGGFPEMFMEELAANRSLMRDIRDHVERGFPVYAECGGLMVLAEQIQWQDRTARFAGALPIDIVMHRRPQGYGFMELEGTGNVSWPGKGEPVRCHEFHYSRVVRVGEGVRFAYRVTRGFGVDGQNDGILYKNVFASYAHIHSAGAEGWAPFLAAFWRQRKVAPFEG
ncbi:MAG: hydrogenobyrinic acid a,c-diamide synthase (glutamine-hydrolyzing) [Magnetococcales bacterium]|nr:hydrogenobyrinic acid a,c-diamide synthase (glutamine-hydrolyzing) [Magnetococcales bacterium]